MATDAPRPVPRPRRTVGGAAGAAASVTLTDREEDDVNGNNKEYQNVSIRSKTPEPASSSSSSSPSHSSSSLGPSSSSVDEVDQQNNNSHHHQVDIRNPYSNILMQIDQFKVTTSEEEPVKPKPAPRSRAKHQPLQYENTEIRKGDNCKPEIVISSATGAIKKQPTKTAPPRPPSPVFRSKTPEMGKRELLINESGSGGGSGEKMTRSSSSNTLDSSQDGSEASSGTKFKTSSPGQVIFNQVCFYSTVKIMLLFSDPQKHWGIFQTPHRVNYRANVQQD